MEGRRVLTSNFPSVLNQYWPQETQEKARGGKESDEDKENDVLEVHGVGGPSSGEKSGGKEEEIRPPLTSIPCRAPRSRDHVTLKREATLASLGGARTARMRQQEAQHFEHIESVWQQAKGDVREERLEQLQEKVALQHKLVAAQDLHARQIREQEEEKILQKRTEDKQRKAAREAQLQGVCRQSLEEDRKRGSEERRRSRSTASQASTPTSQLSNASHASGNSDKSSSSNGSNGNGNGEARHRHPGYRPSLVRHTSPMREMEEAEDEGDPVSPDHQQRRLSQMYGKGAGSDYFHHPKGMQGSSSHAPQAARRRSTMPKAKQQVTADEGLVDTGHIGAGDLWDSLRKDSMSKLIRNDLRFPHELKSAFSAFVRERLTKHSRPVERSFCASADVPDMEKLMDQSKLRATRLYRHKTELMYRSSLTNKDRTAILLHSNPLHDIVSEQDSISRYLPSWQHDGSDVSDEDYMKWVKERRARGADAEGGEAPRAQPSRQASDTQLQLQDIWDNVQPRGHKAAVPRIQFLTEKAAECPGSFTARFLEEKEQREKPQPHHVTKSYSSLEFSHPSSAFTGKPGSERGRSTQSAMQLKRYRSDWEPLSMTALVEYKALKDTEGEGEFEHGRMKMWPVKVAEAAS